MVKKCHEVSRLEFISFKCHWGIKRCTVEPRYNEVPRDWGNVFVISRVRYRKPRYNEFAGKQPKCSLYRGLVNDCF